MTDRTRRGGTGDLTPWLIPAAAMLVGAFWLVLRLAAGIDRMFGGRGWLDGHPSSILTALHNQDPGSSHLPLAAPTVWQAITLAAVLAGLSGGVAVPVWLFTRRNPSRPTATRNKPGRYEQLSPQWAKPRDLGELVVDDDTQGRITLGWSYGKLIAALREHSVIAAGATRSGKSTALAVPVILRWQGPLLVCSSKTDLVNLTLNRRASMGPVWVFDPTGSIDPNGELPIPTHRWDPLAYATTMHGALRVADAFVDASPAVQDQGPTAYWKPQSASLLACLMFAARLVDRNMATPLRWCVRATLAENDGGQFRDALAILNGQDGPDARAACDALIYVLKMDSRQRDSVIGTVRAVLQVFDDPRVVAACTGPSDIDPVRLLDGKPRALYLVATRQEQQRLAPLFSALVAFVDRAVSDRAASRRARTTDGKAIDDESERLLMVLDEVAKLAPLEQLPDIASEIGGEGGALLTLVQDFSQLRDRYRETWRTLVNNHPCGIALSGIRDELTQKFFAENTGKETAVDRARSWKSSGGDTNTSEQLRREPVIDQAGVRTLPRLTGIVVYLNRKPIRIGLRPYWDTPELAAMVRPASAVVAWPADVPPPAKVVLRKRPSAPVERPVAAKPLGAPVNVLTMETPKDRTPNLHVVQDQPTLAAILTALDLREARRVGVGADAPVLYDGRFFLLGKNDATEITDPVQLAALQTGARRQLIAAAAAAAERGEVERVGDSVQMPFRYAGEWFVLSQEGLQHVTDPGHIAACEKGLARMRETEPDD